MSMRIAVLGLVVLAACAGCATGTGSVAGNGNGNGMASPANATVEVPKCEGGWYDTVAAVCDSVGD